MTKTIDPHLECPEGDANAEADGGGEKLVHFGGAEGPTNVVTLRRFEVGARGELNAMPD